jgi:hypothetical protein
MISVCIIAGYATREQMARWHGVSVQQINKEMERVKGSERCAARFDYLEFYIVFYFRTTRFTPPFDNLIAIVLYVSFVRINVVTGAMRKTSHVVHPCSTIGRYVSGVHVRFEIARHNPVRNTLESGCTTR